MKSKLEFHYETAENFLEELLQEKEKKQLSDIEKKVFRGSLKGWTYEEMRKNYDYSVSHLKETGMNLFNKLSIENKI